jgi:uncharacterized protein YggE
MKTLHILLAICVLFSIGADGQELKEPPTIHVTGTAEISVPPDAAVFSLEVTKLNKDLASAKRETDDALAKIIMLTKRYDIKPENVRTDHISVEMKYQYIRDRQNPLVDEDGDPIGVRTFLGYEVSTTVVVRLTDLSRFEDFFSAVLLTGLTEIDGVDFAAANITELRAQARVNAMKAAKEKADAMASAIGQNVGKAIFITEGITQRPIAGLMANTISVSAAASEPVATFAPGSIKVTAQVTVTFLLN